MAFLTNTARFADAIVVSERAEVIVISAANTETLLMSDPKVAISFLKKMASRLQDSQTRAMINA